LDKSEHKMLAIDNDCEAEKRRCELTCTGPAAEVNVCLAACESKYQRCLTQGGPIPLPDPLGGDNNPGHCDVWDPDFPNCTPVLEVKKK
jgi:hypothetical protein